MSRKKTFLQSLFRWLGLAGDDGRIPAVAGLLPPEEFLERLQQERLRADRTGSHFTLILFGISAKGLPEEACRRLVVQLATVIRDRIRRSDVKGFHIGPGVRVGVLLPNTRFENALILVQAIEERFANHVMDTRGMPGRKRRNSFAISMPIPNGKNRRSSRKNHPGIRTMAWLIPLRNCLSWPICPHQK